VTQSASNQITFKKGNLQTTVSADGIKSYLWDNINNSPALNQDAQTTYKRCQILTQNLVTKQFYNGNQLRTISIGDSQYCITNGIGYTVPQSEMGKNGDTYLDKSDGKFYIKINNNWVEQNTGVSGWYSNQLPPPENCTGSCKDGITYYKMGYGPPSPPAPVGDYSYFDSQGEILYKSQMNGAGVWNWVQETDVKLPLVTGAEIISGTITTVSGVENTNQFGGGGGGGGGGGQISLPLVTGISGQILNTSWRQVELCDNGVPQTVKVLMSDAYNVGNNNSGGGGGDPDGGFNPVCTGENCGPGWVPDASACPTGLELLAVFDGANERSAYRCCPSGTDLFLDPTTGQPKCAAAVECPPFYEANSQTNVCEWLCDRIYGNPDHVVVFSSGSENNGTFGCHPPASGGQAYYRDSSGDFDTFFINEQPEGWSLAPIYEPVLRT
jgi:hypothetical protein